MMISIQAKHVLLVAALFFGLLALGIYLFRPAPQIITNVEGKPESTKSEPPKKESKPEISKPVKTEAPKPQPKWEMVMQGQVDVTKPWTRVGSYSGPIIIELSGTAVLDHTGPMVSPDGVINHPAPNFFTLPRAPIFCALARFGNGNPVYIGSRYESALTGETEVWLGPNEDANRADGAGFTDNSGVWAYKIFILK
jgi:hypothetical protein